MASLFSISALAVSPSVMVIGRINLVSSDPAYAWPVFTFYNYGEYPAFTSWKLDSQDARGSIKGTFSVSLPVGEQVEVRLFSEYSNTDLCSLQLYAKAPNSVNASFQNSMGDSDYYCIISGDANNSSNNLTITITPKNQLRYK